MPQTDSKTRKRPFEGSSRPDRRTTRQDDEAEEEDRLTALLFGRQQANELTIQPTASQALDPNVVAQKREAFSIDRRGDLVNEGGDDLCDEDALVEFKQEPVSEKHGHEHDDEDDNEETDALSKPAWIDQDDSRIVKSTAHCMPAATLQNTLRASFYSSAVTDWARVDKDSSAVETESAPLLTSSRLPSGQLQITRCPNANLKEPAQCSLQVVQFDPASNADRPILMAGGFDKTLRFFRVGTDASERVQGIHCEW
jgi:hypothetical protein